MPESSWMMEKLLANARLHERHFPGPRPVEPQRRLAIVACMDSRLDIFDLFGLSVGEAHVLRNAGGIITDDMLRSLVLSQRALGTREIVLLHHTDCGLQKMSEEEMQARITDDVGEPAPYEFGMFQDVDEDVRESLRRLRAHKFLPHRDAVRGFVYDVANGRLREIE